MEARGAAGVEARRNLSSCFPGRRKSFSVAILNRDKNAASPSRCDERLRVVARRRLPSATIWRGRFFPQPLLDALAFLDLDSPAPGAMTNEFRLSPGAVARASAFGLVRNYQAWFTLGRKAGKARQAATATRVLQEALGSDPNARGPRRQGGMPGSRNNNPSPRPSDPVTITHGGPGVFMSEPVFLSVTAKSEPQVEGENPIAAPHHIIRPRATDQSSSGKDRANAMRFFGVNPYASAGDALFEIRRLAEGDVNKFYRERREGGHDSGTAPDPGTVATSGRNFPAAGK